jgi:N-acetylmuramoyl-L-alanine amidase
MRRLALIILLLFSFQFQTANSLSYKNAEAVQIFWGTDLVHLDSVPIRIEGQLFVPLYDLRDQFRFKLYQNPKTRRVELTRFSDGLQMSFKQNSNVVILKNNETSQMNQPFYYLQNQFYVPAEEFFKMLGYSYQVDGNQVKIYTELIHLELLEGQLRVYGKAPFDHSVTVLPGQMGFKVEFKNAKWLAPQREILGGTTLVDRVFVTEQSGQNALVLELRARKPVQYVIFREESENMLKIAISPAHAIEGKKVAPVTIALMGSSHLVSENEFVSSKQIQKKFQNDEDQVGTKLISSGSESFPSQRALWLPKFKSTSRKINLVVAGEKQATFTPVFQKGVLYVPAKWLLPGLGMKSLWDATRSKLQIVSQGTVEKKVLRFDLRNARINDKYKLLTPPFFRDKILYLPLITTCRHLGLGARLDTLTNTIYVSPRISEIYVEQTRDGNRIVVESTLPMKTRKALDLKNPERLMVDIPGMILDVPSHNLNLRIGTIQSIRAGQVTDDTVRLVLDLSGPLQYGLGSSPSGRKMFIDFVNWVNVLKWEKTMEGVQVEIRATQPMKYDVFLLKNPQRLVLQVQDAYLKVDPQISVGFGGIQQIRSSQFSFAPLASRMVFDLDQFDKYEKRELDGGRGLILNFKGASTMPLAAVEYTNLKQVKENKNPAINYDALRNYPYLKGKKIMVDAGHGGDDPGSPLEYSLAEKDLTLQISLKIKNLLLQAGAVPLMVRESDSFVSMEDRARFANNNEADALVSVHLNSFTKPYVSGTETYYYKNRDYDLAKLVHENLIRDLGRVNKGLKKSQMFILNHTEMPGVLLEPGYLSNPEEATLLKNDLYQNKLAQSVLAGFNEYFKNESQSRP